MEMQMFLPRSGHLSKVQTNIEPLGTEARPQGSDGGLQEMEQFFTLLIAQLLHLETVTPRNDHQMAIGIGKLVHHHKSAFPLVKDEILFILSLGRFLTEKASLLPLVTNVDHPPWSPNRLHRFPRYRGSRGFPMLPLCGSIMKPAQDFDKDNLSRDQGSPQGRGSLLTRGSRWVLSVSGSGTYLPPPASSLPF